MIRQLVTDRRAPGTAIELLEGFVLLFWRTARARADKFEAVTVAMYAVQVALAVVQVKVVAKTQIEAKCVRMKLWEWRR